MCQLVLVDQARTEQERVVDVEGARDSNVEEPSERVVLDAVDDAEHQVGCKTDVETHVIIDELLDELRVFDCSDAVLDAIGA